MKLSLKNKSSAIISSTLVAAFLLLHYFVYMDDFGGNYPLLQSYTDPPYDSLQKLHLCEEKYPSYLNPFRKVQHIYQTYDPASDTNSECNLIEKADSRIFTVKMKAENWNPKDYWAGYEEEGFMRPLAGGEYANILFFLVQYGILAAFVFVILKPEGAK